MGTELAYLNNPLQLEFDANIIHKTSTPDGRIALILRHTYFYPTGGGQEHDTGVIGEAQVIDVFKDEKEAVIHVVDRDVPSASVPARINRERRLGHMQHHSAQHILTQSIQRVMDLETVSVKISVDSPSTIDIYAREFDESRLKRAENLANDIIYENRPIKSYFITEKEIGKVPFRSPPKVEGQIRVIEVDSFDYSACGGTHCPTTGMVGTIKILKVERRGEKIRVHFVAGKESLRYFQDYHDAIEGLVRLLGVKPDSLCDSVTRQVQLLHSTQEELQKLRLEFLPIEARKLIDQGKKIGARKLVSTIIKDWSPSEVRALSNLLQKENGVVAFLAVYDGQKLSLTVSCADDTGLSANELLKKQLAEIGGKGGGNARTAQGGGIATDKQVETLFSRTEDYLREATIAP